HPRAEPLADVLERTGGDLVREAHALELLVGLDRARLVEEGRGVRRLAEAVEEGLRVRRRLAHHPVGGLRAERELEADALEAAPGDDAAREVERAGRRRPRVARVVAEVDVQVARPRLPRRVVDRRLHDDERRLAGAREDRDVVALHAPEVREVEDVVGRTDDERVEVALGHERTHPLELRVVSRPGQAGADDSLCGAGMTRPKVPSFSPMTVTEIVSGIFTPRNSSRVGRVRATTSLAKTGSARAFATMDDWMLSQPCRATSSPRVRFAAIASS